MARLVPETPNLPRTSHATLQSLYQYDNDLNKMLFTYLSDLARRANGGLQTDGSNTFDGTMRLTETADVTLTSTDHAFQIGPDTGFNLAMDSNEIQARNNGVASSLFLNAEGGLVSTGAGGIATTGGVTAVGGTFSEFVSITRTLTPQLQLTRTSSTINTNIQLVNDSGSVYIGHGSANTFVAGNSANLSSAANQFIAASSSGLSILGGTAVNALAAGEYTPSLNNTTNVDSTTPLNSNYMRIGNQVIVHGSMVIDATAGAGTLTTVGISLPIASDFTGTVDANGIMGSQSGVSGRIIANVAGNRADMHYLSNTTSAATYYYSFMYTVK